MGERRGRRERSGGCKWLRNAHGELAMALGGSWRPLRNSRHDLLMRVHLFTIRSLQNLPGQVTLILTCRTSELVPSFPPTQSSYSSQFWNGKCTFPRSIPNKLDITHHTPMVIAVEGSSLGEGAKENLPHTWQEFDILVVMLEEWLGKSLHQDGITMADPYPSKKMKRWEPRRGI